MWNSTKPLKSPRITKILFLYILFWKFLKTKVTVQSAGTLIHEKKIKGKKVDFILRYQLMRLNRRLYLNYRCLLVNRGGILV